MNGTACDDDIVWLLDFDPSDGTYYQVNPTPLEVRDGEWSWENKPIGDESDKPGTEYPIVALRVTPECSQQLQTADPGDDDTVTFNPLPAECPAPADTANMKTVYVIQR